MKRNIGPLFVSILLTALAAANAHAQNPQGDAHVAAAKAAVSPQAGGKPWQSFDSVFRQQCTPPRPGARKQEDEPVGSNAPLEPGEQKKLTATPHDQWYYPPTKV